MKSCTYLPVYLIQPGPKAIMRFHWFLSGHATPPWLNSAFNTIEEESEGDETPEEPSDSDGIELDGGIEVNLPGGVEIDVDVEVGDDGVTVEGELTEDEDEEDVGITGICPRTSGVVLLYGSPEHL